MKRGESVDTLLKGQYKYGVDKLKITSHPKGLENYSRTGDDQAAQHSLTLRST